ncbi:Retrovirus-related Pol polyprotein from transposon TNT 1-94, partial [Glycine soja]
LMDKAHTAIILSLRDEVLRQVLKEKTTSGIWLKLEGLYMTKSLVNRLYLKQALYSRCKKVELNIDDEDQALLLLCALPKSFSHFKEALLYGRESLSLVEVQSAFNSKELNERNEQKASVSGEGLIV